ncbi:MULTISPECIES: hypothetical protein [unclassified Thermosynechococcus]|uniref:hypothetical protein n=2 Tax=unclassified Thermosynechococcus TaxID=2622553 RepID=UPI00197DE0DB|nr:MULTISPECIES: hypothetical protein [unclassified Thermosynechococcus]MDR7920875.1 hypothetical protein [Thermosynechococcus sp. HY213]QSF49493.1 hypothetical protein JW907_01515 [Thermosynechococcus sp. TA-1]WNC32809.1 hypothetical protein RHH81_01520 [Thermosynechococcus sp. PKX95]WNC37855.1 hypothetical protein RHI11_01520 [Thermosynechococcus sp. WL11]WNC40377.1 hypothetical protein RHI18_01525 [Thermosynechococcus sp. WL17]
MRLNMLQLLKSAIGIPLVIGGILVLGVGQPARAQGASPLPPEMMKTMVEQLSDSLAKYVSRASCTDIAQLLKMLPTNGTNPAPDSGSIIGAAILSVRNNPELQGIIVSRVGPPLVSKVVECNMISADLLLKAMSQSPSNP